MSNRNKRLNWTAIGLNPLTGYPEDIEVLLNVRSIKDRNIITVRYQDGTVEALPMTDIFIMPELCGSSDD